MLYVNCPYSGCFFNLVSFETFSFFVILWMLWNFLKIREKKSINKVLISVFIFSYFKPSEKMFSKEQNDMVSSKIFSQNGNLIFSSQVVTKYIYVYLQHN